MSVVRRVLTTTIALLALCCGAAAGASAAERADSQGREFWLGFMSNDPAESHPENKTLFLTGSESTTGTVEIPGLAFSQPFSVTPGTVTPVTLPVNVEHRGEGVQARGIHVTAEKEVVVYGLNRKQFTTDAYLGLPVDVLGTDHLVLGYGLGFARSEFQVVAAEDGTTVTITPSVAGAGGRTAGVPYDVALDAGDSYLLSAAVADQDLSGSIVTSTRPVAVFGGHECANVPAKVAACDHLVEQLPSTDAWGKSFLTVPLKTRTKGDTFRVIAARDDTDVTVGGGAPITLDRGQVHEQLITGRSEITATKPVLVAQYSNSSSFDGVTSDPFMMLIPPAEQFLDGYTVTTPASGFSGNHINLVAPTEDVGEVAVDGTPVPASAWVAIGSSGFSGAQVDVAPGTHNLTGDQPFGAFMYGFGSFDSYGYPGGLSVAPIARVTSIQVTPATATNEVGQQHCVEATVLDQNAQPVPEVRVDFAVSGTHSATANADADANGKAPFCYTGTTVGSDTITASVGSVSGTAAKTWIAATRDTVLVAHPALLEALSPLQVRLKPSATLRATNPTEPLAGRTIRFTTSGGRFVCAAVTNAAGDASCAGLAPLLQVTLGLGYRAHFDGSPGFRPSSAKGSLVRVLGIVI